MKKIGLIVFSVFFCVSLALGDEVGQRLSHQATTQLKNSTRQMISAGVDMDEAIKITQVMVEYNFREENILRAHNVIKNAQTEGLPVEPIMNKAFEGMAKHVQAKDIVQAMEKVHSRCAFAHQQARQITQKQTEVHHMGNTIAQGLTAGLSMEDIQKITHNLQQRKQQISATHLHELAIESMMAARDMARLGVSSEDATETVSQAIEHGYSAKEMHSMRNAFMTHSKYNKPHNLARSYTHAIKDGKRADSLGEISGSSHGSASHGGSSGSGGHGGGSGGGGHGGGGSGGGGSGGGGHH